MTNSNQSSNVPCDIPFELIRFIGKKSTEAGFTNIQSLAKAFETTNINKIVRALEIFEKTGKLNLNYMKKLAEILSFDMNEITEITDRHYAQLNKELYLCAEHLDLILENSDRIIENTQYRNSIFWGIRIQAAYIGRRKTLTLGELVFLWNSGSLIDSDGCCGPVYIDGAGGSPLTGRNQYRGICRTCKQVLFGRLPSFGTILGPIFNSTYPYEYVPSDYRIEKLVAELL